MIRGVLSITLIAAIVYAARSFVPGDAAVTGSGAALAFGFLLIAAIHSAHVSHALKLPHLTGYMLCGLLFGPEVLGLVSRKMLNDLVLINGTAVGLIAFLAGCELNFRHLRPRIRAISAISLLAMGIAAVLLFGFVYAITYLLPITQGFSVLQRAAVALVCANVLAAFSPAVVIGVIAETRAKGPLSELAMSVVVLADLLLVITFALSSAWGHTIFPGNGVQPGAQVFIPHLFGSMVAGLIIGAILTFYVRRVGAGTGLFALALIFVAAEAGRAFHLNPLLIGLAAGLFLENASPVGGAEVVRATEVVSVPTFAIFFSVVGAELHLRAFFHVAPFALASAALRAFGIFAGTRIATAIAPVEPEIRRLVPLGLLSQTGIAIALAVLVIREFPTWGSVLGTVLLGSIVVNGIIGPVLFRHALARTGEIRGDELEDVPARAVAAEKL